MRGRDSDLLLMVDSQLVHGRLKIVYKGDPEPSYCESTRKSRPFPLSSFGSDLERESLYDRLLGSGGSTRELKGHVFTSEHRCPLINGRKESGTRGL